MKTNHLEVLFGVQYLPNGISKILKAGPNDAYTYTSYVGKHTIQVEQGDSVWYLKKVDGSIVAHVTNGPIEIESEIWGTVIRGYRVYGDKSVRVSTNTNLPYVNGCSTAQLFPPDRAGDPTFQLLKIPPHSSEQAHHIHSTVRIVYVLDGEGVSKVGTQDKCVEKKLKPGMVILLEKMAPHHFETSDKWLTVVPLHIFSSLPGGIENNHPMFNGTFLINQGR